ncbi:GNAT family N-acetyltransferase [Halomicronema sp. CCY15110]|uniref:GNAT family N-acetyltransferase n=1 Tax=Halomicronema sp. CCY15110 TaxID=2767773 RepID=UPI00195032F2|nr:GNAT family N-acetyltransferase [Halomicronema sp. CCY15110]
MKLTIRPATLEDAPAIHAAEQATALEPGCLVSAPEELCLPDFERKIKALETAGRYIVAETQDQVVGHACLAPMELRAIAHVFRLTVVVHPKFTRQGIGNALMADLLQSAAEDSRIQKIELLVRATNQPAIHLYQKHGFVEEGRFHKRVCLLDGTFVDDISMAWFPSRAGTAEQPIAQIIPLSSPALEDARAVLGIHYAAVRLGAISAYPQEVVEAWSRRPDDDKRIQGIKKGWIENPEMYFVVAKVGDRIVGFGQIDTRGEVQGVYVHPIFGRQGIGGRLLAALEEWAIAAGIAQLHLDSSLNAQAFYQRNGFEVVEYGQHQLRSGLFMDCVKMRKLLNASTIREDK